MFDDSLIKTRNLKSQHGQKGGNSSCHFCKYVQKCYYLYDTKQTEKGRENGQYGRCPLTVAGFMINCILYVCVIVDLRKVSNFSAISWRSGI